MIKILLTTSFRNELYKIFKSESKKITSLIKELKKNPHKGKILGHIGNISLRELKYKSFRFYFILEKNKIILYDKKQIQNLLIKFIKISKKNNQQKTINEIKRILEIIDYKSIA